MKGSDLLDQRGLDTHLARQLLHRGDLDQRTLEGLLTEVRTQRPSSETLARVLLRRDLLSQATLEAALAELAANATLSSSGPPPPVSEEFIGEYVIRDLLGAGGMGVVHLVEHTGTGARYALKTLRGVSDPEALLRFQREAEGQARVDAHPNVVRIHSFGQFPGGLYLVMDLVSGGSLAHRLEAGALTPEESARIVRDVARGLAHIHQRGVLHRDLKPENLLLDGDVPKLTDFGLAKLVGEDSLTVSGTVLGTPAFMAPEQIDRARAELGPWTDVYGAGAVLYRCLTGRNPFTGGTALSVMLRSLEEDPPRPRSLNQDIPPALEAICLRALAKNAGKRFQSAADLADSLERFLAGESAAPSGPPALLGAAAALLVFMLSLFAWALASPAPRPTPPAETAAALPTAPPEPMPLAETKGTPPGPPELPLPRSAIRFMAEDKVYAQGKAAATAEDFVTAVALFERVLRDELTGKVRGGVAAKLGRLLCKGAGIPSDVRRGTALLLEGALQREEEAVWDLALGLLSPRLAQALATKTGARVERLELVPDEALAAVCVRIHMGDQPDRFSVLALREVFEGGKIPLPSLPDAYRALWAAYAKTYPERAMRLLATEPPTLPLPAGLWNDAEWAKFQRAEKGLLPKQPDLAAQIFERLLFDANGRLRKEPARHLGQQNCLGHGVPQNLEDGLDLLFEATLRGDGTSQKFLCLSHLDDLRQELSSSSFLVREQLNLGLEPNLPLAAACARLFEQPDNPRNRKAVDELLGLLSKANVEIPKDTSEAYLFVWRHYVRRLRARKTD